MSIHSQNDRVILEFGLKKPAFRICVNTPTTHGSIGLTTGLDPAMTLGCGGYGGNITSDNISPRHLLNVKRLAYEMTPVANLPREADLKSESAASSPDGAVPAASVGINPKVLSRRIDEFLGSRGYRSGSDKASAAAVSDPPPAAGEPSEAAKPATPVPPAAPLEFICEDDVRQAIRAGRTLLVSERAIVTPLARELAEQHRIFRTPPWRG
jgi:acetaldehyde dehydrogenase (acetylating)